ncbi:amidohydrolase family protein [Nocardia vinacea]|uniref:amidohydrolase family protein n=1 Tax=Nocardia vinacea TaxID=96468 RepID=UPI00341EAEBA
MVLEKVALEEAFVLPEDAGDFRSLDPAQLQKFAYANGVDSNFLLRGGDRLAEFDEVRLREMDTYGIDHVILSLCGTHSIEQILDTKAAVAKARKVNDFLATVVAAHPTRYSGFASVALQDPAAAVAELERSITQLGFKGVLINGYTNIGDAAHGRYLDDPANDEFWAAADELDAPVYIHPRTNLFGGAGIYEGHSEMLGHVWGYAMETATHVIRVVLAGVFDRHPGAKLIVGHLGEGIPALLGRLQYTFGQTPQDKQLERRIVDYFADNILFTTSGNFNDQALVAAMLTVGEDNIMFSVDYPWARTEDAAPWIENAAISESTRRKIAAGNARRIFDLPVSGPSRVRANPV